MTVASDRAARKFFGKLFPDESFDYTDSQAKSLIRTAFAAYATVWSGHNFRIEAWQYPFDMLEKGEAFTGDEPWSVLFRRAVELAEAAKAQ
jgi:hypothetical protein